ncbi:MAG: VanZ family protein [Bacteroidota bacterium]
MLQDIKKLLEHNAVLLAIIATIIIAFLSLSVVPSINLGLKVKNSDKILHTLAYFALSTVWLFTLKDKLKRPYFKVAIGLILTFYGIILEALQGELTNYRTADLYDIIANTLGILLAFTLFDRLIKWYDRV